jgi:hypothetical protein
MGRRAMKEQEWLKDLEVVTCPLCKAKQLPNENQPQSGTHAYTIVYECGAEVVCACGYEDSCKVELKCGEKKIDLIDTLIACRNVAERYFQDQMNRTETKEQKLNFECLKWSMKYSTNYTWNQNDRSIDTPHDFDIEWDEFIEYKDNVYFTNFIQEAIEGYLKENTGTYELTYYIPDIELTINTIHDRFDVKDVIGRESEAKWNLMKKVYEKERK